MENDWKIPKAFRRKTAQGMLYCRTCRVNLIPKTQYLTKHSGKRRGWYCSEACVEKIWKEPWKYPKRRRSDTAGTIAAMKRKARASISANFYTSGEWRVLRYEVLVERGPTCEACGQGKKDGKKIHVDHIKPRHLFPLLELEKSNLQILCEDCNLGKGAWDFTDWTNKNKKDEKTLKEIDKTVQIAFEEMKDWKPQ